MKIIKAINNAFITFLLMILYLIGVGFTALLIKTAKIINPQKQRDSYWLENSADSSDYKSSY